MEKACWFDDPIDFSDFVRSVGASVPTSDYQLLSLEGGGHVLSGYAEGGLFSKLRRGKRTCRFDVLAPARISLIRGRSKATEVVVTDRISSPTLHDLVGLREVPDDLAELAFAVFWCRDADLVGEIIGTSIRLGNDRVQFSDIVDGEEPVTLIRIESPPRYLIERTLDEHADQVGIYGSTGDDVFVPLGFAHPLVDSWRRSETKGDWVFFKSNGELTRVPRPEWQDAYSLIDFDLAFPTAEQAAVSTGTPPRFSIPVRLHAMGRPSDAELWLLDAGGLERLEDLLRMLGEEGMRPFEVAMVQGESNAGEFVFVREKHSGRARNLDFGGQALSPFLGLNNLFIPVDCELLPPLRRDLYRDLFGLQNGQITVVLPSSESEREDVEILKISTRAFVPVTGLVDHLVRGQTAVLEERIAASVFDLGPYAHAPMPTGLKSEKSSKKKAKDASNLPEQLSEPVSVADDDEVFEPSMDGFAKTKGIDESLLPEIRRQEIALERQIVRGAGDTVIWTQLLTIKRQLEQADDALVAAVESLWLTSPESSESLVLWNGIGDLAEQALEGTKAPEASLGDSDAVIDPATTRATVFAALSEAPDPDRAAAGQIDGWIGSVSEVLKQYDENLRIKERWLAWGVVLQLNRDERFEVELRDRLRTQIVENGLGLEDCPPFLRTRIFLDRGQDFGADGESGDIDESVEAALRNLESLAEIAGEIPVHALATILRATLARAFGAIGGASRTFDLIAENERVELGPALGAWANLFHLEACRVTDPQRCAKHEERVEALVPKAEPLTAEAIQSSRESFRQREDLDSPAAFLAQENSRRRYPRGDLHRKGHLFELANQLEDACANGDETMAISAMRNMMTIEDDSEYDDYVKLPQFVEGLVTALERFRFGERGGALGPVFEAFAARAPQLLTKRDPFYGCLLEISLAHGLLVIENLDRAAQHLDAAIVNLSDAKTELDVIDGSSAVVTLIEKLPLERRAEPLSTILSAATGVIAGNVTGSPAAASGRLSPYLSNDRLIVVVVKLLEQVGEAAVSKDQLSLDLFRGYQLHDEFLILQRLASESFCGAS